MLLFAAGPAPLAVGAEPAAADSEAAPVSIGQITQILKRLEAQNTKLAEQNARLVEQNAKLAEQNQSLARQLVDGAGATRRADPLDADAAAPPAPTLKTKPVILKPPAARPTPPDKPVIDI
ncbi:MAG: hypothetical protein FJ189_13050, partial [Gammaproteobacteria bacterium]|nr:hypothetical protein [Gammaproteobacteria bacterium]